MRSYRIFVELEKTPSEETVADALTALRKMPAVFYPSVDAGHRNVHGLDVARFTFTLRAAGMDVAGTIGSQLFEQAARDANLDTGKRVIEIDEGPQVEQLT